MGDGTLTKTEILDVYRKLMLARMVEEKIRQEYHKDEMKSSVHLGIGGEAIPVGVWYCLPDGSKTFATYRNHALYVTTTDNPEGLFAELFGKATGPAQGKAGSMHLFEPAKGLMATSSVVGTTIPLAVGAALANAYRESDDIVAVFFGDGAVEEGVFWESLNFACLRRLRVLFVCEDNGLAIHTPTAERQGFRSIDRIVAEYDCHVSHGKGSDIQEVIKLTRQMLDAMSQDPRPGFLHLKYLRFLEHVGPNEDFDAGYRRRPAPEELEQLDPVFRLETDLGQNGYSLADLSAVQAELTERVDKCVDAARQAPFPSPSDLYAGMLS